MSALDFNATIPCKGNKEQSETVCMLLDTVENLTVTKSEYDDGALVFEGQGIDGPVLGWIELDGHVAWICGG